MPYATRPALALGGTPAGLAHTAPAAALSQALLAGADWVVTMAPSGGNPPHRWLRIPPAPGWVPGGGTGP